MPEGATSSALVQRIERLRRRVYRLIFWHGAMSVASGGIYAFLAIIALDWWLHLPSVPRLAIVTFFFLGFGLATLYWVVQPMGSPFDVDRLARRLERYHPDLTDRMTSAVNFIRDGRAATSPMARHVVEGTENLVAERSLESAVTLRPTITAAFFFIASTGLLFAVAISSQDWVVTGLQRYLGPFGEVEWPRRVEIIPLTGELRVPMGDSATVRMRVERGLTGTTRGVVRLQNVAGEVTTLAMNRLEDRAFEATIEPVTEKLLYWFEAGDDSTQRQPFLIRALERPAIEDLQIRYVAPEYQADPEEHLVRLDEGAAGIPLGSRIRLEGTSSRALASEGEMISVVEPIDGAGPEPLHLASEDGRRFYWETTLEGDLRFILRLVAADGLTGRPGAAYEVKAIHDAAPTVRILSPRGTRDVTVSATVAIHGEARDDFGLAQLWLTAQVEGRPDTLELPLWPEPASSDEKPASAPQVHLSMEGEIHLRDLSVAPGQVVLYDLLGSDRYTAQNRAAQEDTQDGANGVAGQIGRAGTQSLRIISNEEFQRRIRERLRLFEARLRQAILDQGRLGDELAELVKQAVETADALEQRAGDMARAAGRQSRLASSALDMAEIAEQLSDDLRTSGIEAADAIEQLRRWRRQLSTLAEGSMRNATASLQVGEARPMHAEPLAAALDTAQRESVAARNGLQAVLDEMVSWSEAESMVSRMREWIGRQEQIRGDTNDVGRETLGLPAEELTPEQREALTAVLRRQEQLNREIARTLEARRAAGMAGETAAASSTAPDFEIPEGTDEELEEHLATAAQALGENRTAVATIEQKEVEKTLKKRVQASNREDLRQLERLQKDLTKSLEILDGLIEQQRDLKLATTEWVQRGLRDDESHAIYSKQVSLRRNTRWFGEDLARLPGTMDVARLVRDAALAMGEAESRILDHPGDDVVKRQDEALAALEEARETLRRLNEETEREVAARTLDQIRDLLQELHDGENAVADAVHEVAAKVKEAGRIGRLEAREVSNAAKDQQSLIDRLGEVRGDLEAVPVFLFAIQRVERWMTQVVERLGQREVDTATEALARRAAAELGRLIEALDQTRKMATEEEFASEEGGDSGGSGSGQNGQEKPVPTMTELLVLRALQVDVRTRTEEMAKQAAGQESTEETLREIRDLGADQSELSRLAQELTKAAREGS